MFSSPSSSSNTSASSSPSNRSDYDYSSSGSNYIDELDQRSRKLTSILRKNVDRAERRKNILDVVKNKAWLLEDQVKILEKQTATVKNKLNDRRSCRRIVAVCVALVLSVILIINKYLFQQHHE